MECGSDHKLLRIELEFPGYTVNNTVKTKSIEKLKNRKYKLHLLNEESIQELYKTRLDKIFRNLTMEL